MKKLLLTLGTVAAVAAPVASVVACGSTEEKSTVVNLSVAANQKPNYDKLPTTSWWGIDAWDRNLFLFEKGTEALANVESATGTKKSLDDDEIQELTPIKSKLNAIVADTSAENVDKLFANMDKTFTVATGKAPTGPTATTADQPLPAASIELMAHDGPYTTIDGAKHELASNPTNAGKTATKNIFLEVLYVKTTQIGTFLKNINDIVVADKSASKLSDDQLKVWTSIYSQIAASL